MSRKPKTRPPARDAAALADGPARTAAAALATLLVVATVAYAAWLHDADADRYYRAIQEDESLEWGTFWAFALATGIWVATMLKQRLASLPWFALGLVLFCAFVALEEISWGQRVVGYRPPAYFLQENFQQELNLHNVVSTDLRKLALKAVILGYGVLLPLLGLLERLRRFATHVRVILPPLALAPIFLITYALYELYPWTHTGEWVEFLLGLGFLFAALDALWVSHTARRPTKRQAKLSLQVALTAVAGAGLFCLVMGAASAAGTQSLRRESPELREAARVEAEALRSDWLEERVSSRCGLHKRLYTFVESYRETSLSEGRFAGLVNQGLPEERARFFLDPWNSPYWVRHRCSDDRSRRRVFVYSFGPNRRRDSSRWEILGDDVGTVVGERGFE